MTVVNYDYCPECDKKGVTRRSVSEGWRYGCKYCGWENIVSGGPKG